MNSCADVLQRMQEWNYCWRRHFGSPKFDQYDITKPIECPIWTENGEIAIDEIGAPLYGFSFFGGQGFGRYV